MCTVNETWYKWMNCYTINSMRWQLSLFGQPSILSLQLNLEVGAPAELEVYTLVFFHLLLWFPLSWMKCFMDWHLNFFCKILSGLWLQATRSSVFLYTAVSPLMMVFIYFSPHCDIWLCIRSVSHTAAFGVVSVQFMRWRKTECLQHVFSRPMCVFLLACAPCFHFSHCIISWYLLMCVFRQQDPWLGLYLSACKLLDLVLALPPTLLPQFQM